jgi:D-alanyl-lipoteichoic acid acyltransferase DltB (MBOAT superfamily)
MLFNSLTYLLFLAVCAPLCVFGPARLRRTIFLVGSLAFYAFWRIDFTCLMIFNALIDYCCSIMIGRSTSPVARRGWLAVSLVLNFGLLAFFKYTYFLIDSGHSIAQWFGGTFQPDLGFQIILPLGISFYTFQTVSYTIDVYRGLQEPIRDFPLFLTYVTFWPQLVAGPILRADEVVPQLQDYRRPTAAAVMRGLDEILAGLFKKVVLADTIGRMVDEGFAIEPARLGTLDVWCLAFAFGFQIYFDFAGYSSIALGSARVLGFDFPENFRWPYLATSVREFWKRWHISLSSWIRDYLYLPLQGVRFRGSLAAAAEPAAGQPGRVAPASVASGGLEARGEGNVSPLRRDVALFATWFIMGLWHGANWTFALWGIWHALFIWLYRVSEPLRTKLPDRVRAVGGWATTLAVCMLGWIFFRATTVSGSLRMLATAFDPTRLRIRAMRENTYLVTFIYLVGMLLTYAVLHAIPRERVPAWVRYGLVAVVQAVMLAAVFLSLRRAEQFIYFQF